MTTNVIFALTFTTLGIHPLVRRSTLRSFRSVRSSPFAFFSGQLTPQSPSNSRHKGSKKLSGFLAQGAPGHSEVYQNGVQGKQKRKTKKKRKVRKEVFSNSGIWESFFYREIWKPGRRPSKIDLALFRLVGNDS